MNDGYVLMRIVVVLVILALVATIMYQDKYGPKDKS